MTGRFGLEMAIGVLACVGLWVTVDKAAAGVARVWEWARRDRVTPLLEDDDGISEDCANDDHRECEGCWCECGHDIDLPPERSWEELTVGTRGLDSVGLVREHEPWRVEAHLSAGRERRAPWWEAEHRAAYDACGFDFPSGLMTRIREYTVN